MKNKKSSRGFTLIELLVVISIIGILLALSFVGFAQARKSARDSKRKADLEQIRSALEIYRNDQKEYPDDLNALESSSYIAEVPTDPVAGTYTYYYSSSAPNSYILCAFLETGEADNLCGAASCTENCNYKTTNP